MTILIGLYVYYMYDNEKSRALTDSCDSNS